MAHLKTIAKKTSLIGIFISLIILIIAITLFYFHEKIVFILNESNSLAQNQTSAINNNNNSLNGSVALDTRFPKHKLHYEVPSEADMSRVLFTMTSRIQKNSEQMSEVPLRRPVLVTSTTETRKTTVSSTTTAKLYDQLNILVDHDLFMNLMRKYKILKESNGSSKTS
jgi:hypothetical protein